MSFLNPILLAGLAAVSIPVIIHLLNRRKFQRVEWAAMRFLKTSVDQNQRRMRVEDLLLLALRCLLVALLALALARPALKTNAAGLLGARVTGVLILDNSASMAATDGATTRMALARQAAEEIIASLPRGSALAVSLASDVVRPVLPEPTHDLNLVRKVIREAPVVDRATDLLPALQQAVDQLKARNQLRKEIFLVTDHQALGWRSSAEITRLLEAARRERLNIHLVLVGEPIQANLGVSRLRIASGLTPVGHPLRFEAQVSNYGGKDVRDVKVSLHVNADPPTDEATIPLLPSGASRSVSLFARVRQAGYHSVTARIAPDHVPGDDQRSVALRAIQDLRVLLIDGNPGREPRDSQVFYLRHAWQPVPLAEAPRYFIKTTTVTGPEISGMRLDDFDAVVMADVADLQPAARTALEAFVRRGGGLLVFPGSQARPEFYNEQLSLLPARLGNPRGQLDHDDQFFTLQDKDYNHPLVEIWNDPGAGTLASARFYRAFELRPVAWQPPDPKNIRADEPKGLAGEPRIVLKYSDGQAAVMEHTWGQGRVILFGSTANSAWNDLPMRPVYVPLMHRVLGALAMRQEEGLTLAVGDRLTYHLPNDTLGKDAMIVGPNQARGNLRDLRRVELRQGQPTLQYDLTDFNGVYQATIAGDLERVIKFAAQPDPSESSLETLDPNRIGILARLAHLVDWKPGTSLKTILNQENLGAELWLPLLLAALVVALVETILAQRFSRTK
jgi:hypothetical protein